MSDNDKTKAVFRANYGHPKDIKDMITAYCKRTGVSATHAVHRAIKMQDVIEKKLQAGGEIQYVDPKGKVTTLEFLF